MTARATPEQVRAALAYDPETGAISRIRSPRSDTLGPVPLTKDGGGYLIVWCGQRLERAHRAAWVLMTGEWPAEDIDHINRDRVDNRWANLRAASRGDNLRNTTVRSICKTGFKGVSLHHRGKGFSAYARIDGKKKHLGTFPTAEEASEARREVLQKINPMWL